MKLAQGVLRSLTNGLSPRFQRHQFVRALSTTPASGFDTNYDKVTVESVDDFEKRIFSDDFQGGSESSFFRKLDRAERAHDRSGVDYNWNSSNGVNLDGLDDSYSSLTDGMDERLKEAATYFEVDEDEIDQDGYKFRPDANFSWGSTYTPKDLDLRRPGVSKPPRREFEVTTEEVLRKADFRNVRFLANFLTEAGVIIKRSQTKISAKAQRKVAREIKTARAFGLMPFTTMGTKHFAFGRTMEDLDADFEYESHDTHNFVDDAPLDN